MMKFTDKLFFSANVKRIYKQNSSNTNQSNFLNPNFSITQPTKEESAEIMKTIKAHIKKIHADGKKIKTMVIDSTISRNRLSQIKKDFDHNQKPSKITLIKFALGAELNLDLLNKLLYFYGYCLNNKYLPDIICEQFFIKWVYEKYERGKAAAVSKLQECFMKFNINEKIMEY